MIKTYTAKTLDEVLKQVQLEGMSKQKIYTLSG